MGVFIARISRGRSIRSFLGCVIFVPTIFSSIWFAVFGTLSTGAQMAGTQLAQLSTETVLFGTLAAYPAGQALSVISVVLVFSFFITSADSATFVLGMTTEDDPPDDSVAVIQCDIAVATAITAAVEESRNRTAETDVAGEEDDT